MPDPNLPNPDTAESMATVAVLMEVDALVVQALALRVVVNLLPDDDRRVAPVRQAVEALTQNARTLRRRVAHLERGR